MNWVKRNYLLITILVLAAFLRLWRLPAYTEFLGDQGRDLIIVRRFLTRGDLMFIGPRTSVGNMYLGPWYYYLIAPALFLAHFSPLGPAYLLALLGVTTVYLIFYFTCFWFDKKTAWLAALLAATSPVMVYYSLFSWNPNVMPLLSLLAVWLTWRLWARKEIKQLPWLALVLALAINSHYLGLLLFPLVGVFWFWTGWRSRREQRGRQFLGYSFLAVLIFAFFLLPLFLFDLKHQFVNFHAFERFFTQRQTTVNLKIYKGLGQLVKVINQFFANLLLKKDNFSISSGGYLLAGLLLWGLWQDRKKTIGWFLLSWLIVGFLGLGNYKQHLYAHYYGFLYPLAIILLARALKHLKILAYPLIFYFLFLMLSHWHGWQPPVFQLKRAQRVATAICQRVGMVKGGKENYNIVNLAAYNDFRAMAYRYFLLKDCSHPPLGIAHYAPGNLFVIWEDPEKYPDPVNTDIWEIQSAGSWRIKDRFKAFDTRVLLLGKKRKSFSTGPKLNNNEGQMK